MLSAKGFGWGAECNLKYIFEKTFSQPSGGGYPLEKREVEQANKKISDKLRENTLKSFLDGRKLIDP